MQRNTTTSYYEVRTSRMFGPSTPIASDVARHLQSRQYLGTTIVVCETPLSQLSATRKQWLRLARTLLKQRASTLNAEEILRYTHSIMHMQHLQFIAEAPTKRAAAHIYFVTPNQLQYVPSDCTTIYITTPPTASQLDSWLTMLPANALVVDYQGNLGLDKLGLQSKERIEQRALTAWQELLDYLQAHDVDAKQLIAGGYVQASAVDDAFDKLLASGSDFLQRAADFQQLLSLAQPLSNSSPTQTKQFEAVMRIAHRVQVLTPGVFSDYLAATFGKSSANSFFLRDAGEENTSLLSTIASCLPI